MKINGYRCKKCQNNEFMGKSGKWVCNVCLHPIPQSILSNIEFDHKRVVVRADRQDIPVHH